ncbi:MAG: TonB-dependent receptor [Verrucomicrobiales bacterium]|nr:TonB-dependent receptor [Verrucomicrobiales bacterium]
MRNIPLISASCIFLLITTCNAQLSEADTLDPTVVTATRTAKKVSAVPNTVRVIDSNRLRENLPRSLPESFEEIPGVLVQKTAHGQGSPFIRGFTAFRNLLMIDGIRLNHSAFREGPNQYWATIDMLSARQVELVKGQGSMLYGSDAIGGTVNLLTKSADIFAHDKGKAFSSGELLYRWASGEQSHTGRMEGQIGIGGQTGLHLGYTARELGDIRAAGLGTLPKTGFSEKAFDIKLEHYFNPDRKITLAYNQFNQDDAWRTHKTIFSRTWQGTTPGNERHRILDQGRKLAYAQFEATGMEGLVNDLQASLSWHHHSEQRDRIRSGGKRDIQGFDLDSLGSWIQLVSDTRIGELTYGLSYYRDSADTFRKNYAPDGTFKNNAIQGPFGDDAVYDLFGLYLQDTILLNDHLELTGGGRLTRAAADIGKVADPVSGEPISIEDNWHDFSASARLAWDIAGKGLFNLYGGVSEGFRAPNFSDLSRLDSARSNEIETPSPGLSPEHFTSYEVGSRINRERLHAGMAVFFTDIKDLISRTPTGQVIDGDSEVIKRNGSSGYIYGIEVDGRYQISDQLSAFGHFAWNDGKADTFPTSSSTSSEEYVSRLLPASGQLGLRLDATDRFWIELSGYAAARQDRLNTRDRSDTQRIPPGGTPGYVLLNIRSGFQVNEQLLLTAGIENITDEEYRAHGSGQNEPGINFVIGASLQF